MNLPVCSMICANKQVNVYTKFIFQFTSGNSSVWGCFGGLLVIQYVFTVPTIKEALSPLISVAGDS